MDTPLRVMQLVLSLAIGGTEKLVYDLVRGVDRRRVSSIICCLDEVGEFGQELQREGYPLYLLHRRPGIDVGLIQRLRTIIRQEQIDIIQAQQYTPYFYGLMASLWHRPNFAVKSPKIVYTEHGIAYPYQRKLKRLILNPFLLFFADEITTIAEHTKGNLISYENFPAQRIKVIYNGIDLKRFAAQTDASVIKQALGLASQAKVIGIVARLDPVKNHALLLRAFQSVLSHLPETYLLIVGDGPEEQRLKALADTLGLTAKTRFLGARKDIPELLHTFDVFVLPSFSEGMSVTLIEAMGAGLPIIATRVGGNPEVVQDQVTGYLVQNDDDREMAAKLLLLLQNTELRQKMGFAGQQRAAAMFALDQMVAAYTHVYLNVTGLNDKK